MNKYKIYLKKPNRTSENVAMKKNEPSTSDYWSNNEIYNVIKEVIDPEAVDVTSIKMNDNLFELLWDGEELKQDVRKLLLMNAKKFIEFCDIEDLKFYDIIITGSMANYNYTEGSDIDTHVIIDYGQISEDNEFVTEFFKLKKRLWENEITPKLGGHDIELYIQNEHEKHHSSGTFSLIKNEWIIKPTKKIINIDMSSVKIKSADYMNQIDDIMDIEVFEEFEKKYDEFLKNKIKKLRKDALDKNGEYSIGNLVFKILRNSGYIEKLINRKHELLTKHLST